MKKQAPRAKKITKKEETKKDTPQDFTDAISALQILSKVQS